MTMSSKTSTETSSGETNVTPRDNHDAYMPTRTVPLSNTPAEKKPGKKKVTIEVDEDDPCIKQEIAPEDQKHPVAPGDDPRFQQQNQTVRCWVMYTDFYRCENILGANATACTWFKEVFTSICPNQWISRWDTLRSEGRFAWHKHKTQGEFPGDKYGV